MGVRKYTNHPRIYLDMDGVLADFEKGARDAGLLMKDFKMKPGSYRNLPVYPGAIEGVDALEAMGYELFILTKPPKGNYLAATEKLQWVAEHFPDLADRVFITPDKGAVGEPKDILIDDHPEWANAENFGGTVLTFLSWVQILELVQQHRTQTTPPATPSKPA